MKNRFPKNTVVVSLFVLFSCTIKNDHNVSPFVLSHILVVTGRHNSLDSKNHYRHSGFSLSNSFPLVQIIIDIRGPPNAIGKYLRHNKSMRKIVGDITINLMIDESRNVHKANEPCRQSKNETSEMFLLGENKKKIK